jgi:tetratricopeptide (TPR) repeat protein
MQFDPNNKVVKLCAQGMTLEGQGKPEEAHNLFQQAWNESTNDFERFTSAHYVARHQNHVSRKLEWDLVALNLALKINDPSVEEVLPSLYLNIAKCYEDLNDFKNAKINYRLALSFTNSLPDDGYGSMVKKGIAEGLKRIPEGSS